MTYVDGLVAAVPTARREEFIAWSRRMSQAFRKNGALRQVDCWGDQVPEGKLTSLPMAVKCGPDETVVFSWVEWPSKEVRNAAWAALESDPQMQPGADPMPFDGTRMIFGGFEMVVEET